MASISVGENQLQRIIRDLHDAVAELSKEHRETGEPVTDDSSSLHKFSYKLEYLLQFDQKEKTTFLGTRKDYWDYFCDCLAKLKGANDGIRFVKSILELKTSLGKGRAFIRYSLVHQRLADTLQQCLMNHKVTSEWYYARSPFLKSHLSIDIINHLYELNEIQFDVASRGHDLDSDWPTFARRTLGTPAHLWRPPSRCSSVNSLVSSYSQPSEFLPGPDFSPCLLGELGELSHISSCSAADDLRVELDQSELRQQELLERVRVLSKEAGDLKAVIRDLEGQLPSAGGIGQKRQPPQHLQQQQQQQQRGASILSGRQEVAQHQQAEESKANGEFVNHLQADVREGSEVISVREASESNLQAKLSLAEKRNMELLTKLDGALTDKSQQAASYCDSAWKIQELLAKLKEAEAERLEARGKSEEQGDHAQRLAQELRLQEQSLQESRERLVEAEEERGTSLQQAEELRATVGRLQGALSLKERETGNLRTQLQDLQQGLEARERQAEAARRNAQGERGALQQRNHNLKEEPEHNKARDAQPEITTGTSTGTNVNSSTNAGAKKDPTAKKVEDYKAQCTTLMELNAKLLQTVKRNEESTRELAQARQAAERELAALRASEKQLRAHLEAAQLPLEEQERRLLEENQQLEDSVKRALMRAEEAEEEVRRLEKDREEHREEKAEVKEQLASAREELSTLTAQATELEKNLAASRENQEELQRQLEETERRSTERPVECEEGRREGEVGARQTSRLALAEAQLELHTREVLRLQEDAVGLRVQLQVSTEERLKTQALQEVTESSREDLRAQAEQLKAQVEELNRRHVEELLRGREREEALARERDSEARERAVLAAEASGLREEHGMLKRRLDKLAVENAEAREALHRANTETAELGVHVCMLTGQNEEARLRWERLSGRLSEMEEEGNREARSHNTSLEALQEENDKLQEELRQAQALPSSLQESQREIQDLKLQLSSEASEHDTKLQAVTEELVSMRSQLENGQQQVAALETKMEELETMNQNSSEVVEEKNTHIASTQTVLHQKEEEERKLRKELSTAEEQLALAQKACQDLSESLRRTTLERQSSDLKTSAEIDDLYRTKRNLEERLIELIRDKDALWQKSDALEFEQKLREEQTDRELSHCLGCHSQFSWWLRKHNCRLCGRSFCYYCCSNTVSTQQGGTRERCCKDCYTQHSAVVERHPQEELGTPPYPPFNPLTPPSSAVPGVRVAEQSPRPDDAVFDIITEEEVNCIYDSDSLSYTTACSSERGRQGADELNSSNSAGDTTTEESEEIITAVQDAELCLLKSGELTLSVPFSVDEIAQFGDEFRELFVKSSCYSIIPIAIGNAGPTISWVFSSEPKSITFSMVYRDSTDIPLEQAKVMIPLTRCNSHKETIQGQLKVRNPGHYTLIFDNSFSRFISKKVLYRLSVEKPVIYDGSDCP
ncbi:FYVE and coiled-coil domain-containing protein 1 isoform X2 [Clupea harengus]|uniref:FYVE and coiled-coil domain-containing protein 1 n=1 Tax=Clupea harengus TaxID=7950 RepID=A0A6P8EXC0_CLUHA|nr:FYVE and coiled-coil domain-containing protein 1 isoform X2 [Clupea harengus]